MEAKDRVGQNKSRGPMVKLRSVNQKCRKEDRFIIDSATVTYININVIGKGNASVLERFRYRRRTEVDNFVTVERRFNNMIR